MESETRPTLSATLVAGFYGIMALVAWVLALIFHLPSLWHLRPGWPGPVAPWVGLGIGISLGLAVHLGGEAVERWFGLTRGFNDQMAELMGPVSPWQLVVAAAASGVAEELLFRGALLPLVGLVPSALVFGLMHLAPGKEMRFWPVFAAVMGVALGLLYQASGVLMAPILAHFTLNFFGIAALRKRRAEGTG